MTNKQKYDAFIILTIFQGPKRHFYIKMGLKDIHDFKGAKSVNFHKMGFYLGLYGFMGQIRKIMTLWIKLSF